MSIVSLQMIYVLTSSLQISIVIEVNLKKKTAQQSREE